MSSNVYDLVTKRAINPNLKVDKSRPVSHDSIMTRIALRMQDELGRELTRGERNNLPRIYQAALTPILDAVTDALISERGDPIANIIDRLEQKITICDCPERRVHVITDHQ